MAALRSTFAVQPNRGACWKRHPHANPRPAVGAPAHTEKRALPTEPAGGPAASRLELVVPPKLIGSRNRSFVRHTGSCQTSVVSKASPPPRTDAVRPSWPPGELGIERINNRGLCALDPAMRASDAVSWGGRASCVALAALSSATDGRRHAPTFTTVSSGGRPSRSRQL